MAYSLPFSCRMRYLRGGRGGAERVRQHFGPKPAQLHSHSIQSALRRCAASRTVGKRTHTSALAPLPTRTALPVSKPCLRMVGFQQRRRIDAAQNGGERRLREPSTRGALPAAEPQRARAHAFHQICPRTGGGHYSAPRVGRKQYGAKYTSCATALLAVQRITPSLLLLAAAAARRRRLQSRAAHCAAPRLQGPAGSARCCCPLVIVVLHVGCCYQPQQIAQH